jgi:uncharacterized membrane protein
MIWLILGLALWAYSHLMKRITPQFRASLGDKNGRLVATGLTVISIALIVYGFMHSDVIQIWNPPAFMKHINNLLMLIAVFLLGVGYVPGVVRTKMRHPMLGAVKTWALAHLLVNGDLASMILFGSMLAWAVVDMIMINKMQPWNRPVAGPLRNDLIWLVGAAVLMGGIGMIHAYLGYPVFG